MSVLPRARSGGAALLSLLPAIVFASASSVARAEETKAKVAARREIDELGLVALVRAAFRDEKPAAEARAWERARAKASVVTATAAPAMWVAPIDEAATPGGLRLTKEEDGGPVSVLPVERIATIGHGNADDDGGAFEGGRGHVPGVHEARAPILRAASAAESRVPPETIQRVVRQSFGRFRICYESALRTNPALEGRVAVKFKVDPSGEVAVAADSGSDLPDAGVVACVVRGFASLTFPEFSAGVVTVVYPLVFTPATRAIAPPPPSRGDRE
jgi:hypothetical protein